MLWLTTIQSSVALSSYLHFQKPRYTLTSFFTPIISIVEQKHYTIQPNPTPLSCLSLFHSDSTSILFPLPQSLPSTSFFTPLHFLQNTHGVTRKSQLPSRVSNHVDELILLFTMTPFSKMTSFPNLSSGAHRKAFHRARFTPRIHQRSVRPLRKHPNN
jgi:hypothetical protein